MMKLMPGPAMLRLTTTVCALILAACNAPDSTGTAPSTAPSEAQTQPPLDEDPIAMGKRLHETIGCATCHSLDGRKRTAGSYKDIYGTEVTLQNGSTITRDEDYLRRSILKAAAELVKGYPDVMPDYSDTLSDVEVDAFVALIVSLGPQADESM